MSSDPRLTVLMAIRRNNPHWSAVHVLAAIDAKDPLRQPPGDEAVGVFLRAYDGTLGPRGQKAMGGLIAALALMRGETATQFFNCMIGDVPDGVRLTETTPPSDAIEDRLAALEGRPQWTEAMADLLQYLAGTAMMTYDRTVIRKIIVDKLNAAFPDNPNPPTVAFQPERVWPPADCLLASLRQSRKSPCVAVCERSDCPHAGERA